MEGKLLETVIIEREGYKVVVPAYPSSCRYVRILNKKNEQLVCWTATAWENAPKETMGAIMTAIASLNGVEVKFKNE